MTQLAEDVELRRRIGAAAAEQVAAREHSRYALDFERFVYAVRDLPHAGAA